MQQNYSFAAIVIFTLERNCSPSTGFLITSSIPILGSILTISCAASRADTNIASL